MSRHASLADLVAAARGALADAAAVADAYVDDGARYRAVGGHLRHVIEHYAAFLAGAAQGAVHYDRRARDPDVERDPRAALAAIAVLARDLGTFDLPPSTPLRVALECAAAGMETDAPSSVGRELQFLASHAVHHFALMRPALEADARVPRPDFGYAAATLRGARGAAA
ncbi:DinB family protein [Tolypothrix campylonemoides VB511288]|nr:DinB family protein [Tolypothrix campylonemoides VB511288]